MKDKEFKRLNRSELIEIIYQLQLDLQKANEENAALQAALESKELKISNAGSIAEASIGMFDLFSKAQEAADLYLKEIHKNNAEAEARSSAILAKAESEAQAMRREAEEEVALSHKEAADIRLKAQIEAKRLLSEAECASMSKMQDANAKIEKMLKAHAELSSFLKN